MKIIFIFAVCLIFFSCSSPCLSIHLKIFDKRHFLKISSDGGIWINNGIDIISTNEISIDIKNGRFGNIIVTPVSNDGILVIHSDIEVKKYHGALIISVKEGSMRVLNSVSEAHYLASVVGSEMDESFPREAMKAQAVASRTLLYYLVINKKNISDLPDEFQAYRGSDFETWGSARAVEQTAGIVLNYRQKIFYPFFHSTCGGILLPPDIKRGISPGFYPGLKEPKKDECGGVINCSSSPYFHWKKVLSAHEIERALCIRPVGSIGLIMSKEGWISDVEIFSRTSIILTCSRFLDSIWKKTRGGIMSYNFTVKRSGDKYIFEGSGFGHHTGMCQWGAKGMALKGSDYSEILHFYYPDTVLAHAAAPEMSR